MHFTTTTLALALAATVSAHTTMFSVWVNGADQGDGRNVYIRSPPSNSPVKDLASTDLVCNVNGAKAVSSFVKAAAGSTLTFEWFHDNRGDDIIDGSHKGPIITYIAPFTTGNGASSIWTKIAEEGFDSSSKLWAVDKLKTNGGKKDFTLPAGLAAGKYLIRQEIIALHESDAAFNVNSARGAQFYPSCVQIEVTGSGTVVPNQNFNFNTGYTYSDLGILFNLYGSFTSYTIPGPKVFTFAASAPVVATTTTLKAAIPVATTTTAAVVPTTTSKAAAVVPTTTSKAVIPVLTPTSKATVIPTTLSTAVRSVTTSTRKVSTTSTRRPAGPPTPIRGRPTRSRVAQAVTPTANPAAPVITVVCAGNKGQ